MGSMKLLCEAWPGQALSLSLPPVALAVTLHIHEKHHATEDRDKLTAVL